MNNKKMNKQFKLVFILFFIMNIVTSQNLVRTYDSFYFIKSDSKSDTILEIGLKNNIVIDTLKVYIKMKENNKYYSIGTHNNYEFGKFTKTKRTKNTNFKTCVIMKKIGLWKHTDSDHSYFVYHGLIYNYKSKRKKV